MSRVIYLTESIATAVDDALTTAKERWGTPALLRKVKAGEIDNDHRTVAVWVEVDGAKHWLTVDLRQTETGWVVEKKKKEGGMPNKVLSIGSDSVRQALPAETLYKAAAMVFASPSLKALWVPRELEEFFSQWEGDTNFSGPEVLFDRKGKPRLIITPTSGREIWMTWSEEERYLKYLYVCFPEGGSTYAAGQIIDHLREMGISGGEIKVRGPEGEEKYFSVDNCPPLEYSDSPPVPKPQVEVSEAKEDPDEVVVEVSLYEGD